MRLFRCVRVFSVLPILAGGAAWATPTLPSEASGNYEKICADEWTKRGVLDHEMYHYCLHGKREGYRKLTDLADKYADKDWLQGAINAAIAEYSKRDTRDDEMVAYALNQQVEAYLDYEYAAKQPKFDKAAFDQCREEYMDGGPNWEMTMFCYKQKTDGE